MSSVMELREVAIDGETYATPSWEDMWTVLSNLGRMINTYTQTEPLRFDRVVAIARGGWTWARALADYIGVPKVATFQVSFYSSVGQHRDRPRITQPIPISIRREHVLLLDDVVDSGWSLEAGVKYLSWRRQVASVTTAALIYKPTRSQTGIAPQFYAATTAAWVIFPHELRECIREIGQRWRGRGVPSANIRERFLTIGLPQDEVMYFMQLENLI